MLGTNGGGFFNANSAHPYENPTPLTNFVQMLAIFLIPAALCFTFGRMVGDMRQGWARARGDDGDVRRRGGRRRSPAEQARQPAARGARRRPGRQRRCRPAATWKARRRASASPPRRCSPPITTAASCGAVNAMHDSFTPLGGMVPLVLMQLGEVVFGGVGSGLYGMLVFAILAVFIAGLMIGRTPEYLGKKIEALRDEDDLDRDPGHADPGAGGHRDRRDRRRGQGRHRQPRRARLLGDPVRASARPATTTAAPSPACRPTRRSTTRCSAIAMWFGRFGVIVPVLAIAGSLAAKKRLPVTAGTHADARAAVRRAADRHRAAGRPAELRAGARARARWSST